MNSATRKELYNENRRKRQTKARQDALITEYIYTKYFQIYREAAAYYNRLNVTYPTKRDLRRCQEFKDWKKQIRGQTVKTESSARPVQHTGRNYYIVVHPDIPLEQQNDSSESSDLSAPECPDIDLPQQQHLQPTVPDSPEASQHHLQPTEPPAKPLGEKIMQLKIPLLKPTVVAETIQIVTQETVENLLQVAAEEIVHVQDFTTLNPSLEEGLPQHIVDNIINELRADPDLKTMMDDMEIEHEFKQLGMDLDIPENDPFQEEIENLMHW